MPNSSKANLNHLNDLNMYKNDISHKDYKSSIEEDWNFIQSSHGEKEQHKISDSQADLSQTLWEDSNKHQSYFSYNEPSLSNVTHYESTDAVSTCPSSELNYSNYQTNANLLDSKTGIINPAYDELDHIDQLITELEKGVSVISLFNYFLENMELDSENAGELQMKLHETGQIIERINTAVQVYSRSPAKSSGSKKTLPFPFVSRLKHNLTLYSQVVNKYQESLKNSIVDGAMGLYPEKTSEQVLALLDNIGQTSTYTNESKLVDYLKSKAKDIEYLEKSTIRLNSVYQDLYTLLSRRGEHLSSLEEQILISSATIEAGKYNIQKAYKYRKSGWKRLLYFLMLIVITCLLLLVPNILPYIFGNGGSQ